MSDFRRPHCLNRSECSAKSPVTHCRRCWGAHLKKISMASDAEQRRLETVTQMTIARNRTPEFREHMRQVALKHAVFLRPEVIARRDDPEVIKRREATRYARVMAMTPEERRKKYGAARGPSRFLSGADLEMYRQLRAKNISAPECMRLVQEHGRAQVRRNAAAQRAKQQRQKAQSYNG